MEAIRVKDKEWKLAGVHYVRTKLCAMDLVCHWRWNSVKIR